jgi:5-formyltetrahydrofolate cyclo-ligase
MQPEDELLRRRAKLMMRRRFKSHRRALPAAAAEARSAAIRERLLAEIAQARAVGLFWPMQERREVDLRPLDTALRERGVRIAYPRCELDPRHMAFHFVADLAAMAPAAMGYLEPTSDMPLVEGLDVVVVPGLAFDARGYRIGYGGGFYDRALPRLCPPGTSIGVAFDFQLAADIPNTPGDVAVDRIVTDQRVLERQRA